MPYGEHENNVSLLLVVVQRQIAGPSARDDELPQAVLDRSTDQRVILQYLQRFRDQLDGFQCRRGFRRTKKVRNPLEIGERSSRVDQPRQDRARGFGAGFACTRARR